MCTTELKTGIVLVSHGSYGKNLLSVAEELIGPLQVATAEILQEEDSQSKFMKIVTAAKEVEQGLGVLFIIDICGSTPANICLKFIQEHQDSEIITGLNLAMLIKLSTCDRHQGALWLAKELQKTSQRSIQIGTDLMRKGAT